MVFKYSIENLTLYIISAGNIWKHASKVFGTLKKLQRSSSNLK